MNFQDILSSDSPLFLLLNYVCSLAMFISCPGRCVYRDPAKYNPNNKVGKCTRSAQGSTHYCKQHGGGLRCKFPTCSKVAIGKNPQMCRHHGGAKGTRIPMPPPILPDQEGNYPKADIVAAITQAAVGKAAQVSSTNALANYWFV